MTLWLPVSWWSIRALAPFPQAGLAPETDLSRQRRWHGRPWLPIIQQGLGFGEFAGIFLRWIAFSRTGLTGWSFKRISVIQALLFWTSAVGSVLQAGSWATLSSPTAARNQHKTAIEGIGGTSGSQQAGRMAFLMNTAHLQVPICSVFSIRLHCCAKAASAR